MEVNINLIQRIKSINIIKNLFLLVCKANKLEFFRYNKYLQKIFYITIEDYKNIGERFKIGERKGKGKEYIINRDILIFEGEYFNGKKNGVGKELYPFGKTKFEGIYLKGKKIEGKGYDEHGNLILEIDKNGKGKEYYKYGKIQFEGEYLNGKKWNGKGYNNKGKEEFEIKRGKGWVKEYNYYGELIFEGDYIDGKRNGIGKEYYNDGDLLYEGEYSNGKRHGKGKDFFEKGKLRFEGEYLKDKRWNGKGYTCKFVIIKEDSNLN